MSKIIFISSRDERVKGVEILPSQRHRASIYFDVDRLNENYPGEKEVLPLVV
ncbi:MAG: hypothetical protein ACE5K4_12185 [Candidatus Hydrothermarchaeota archaeon]